MPQNTEATAIVHDICCGARHCQHSPQPTLASFLLSLIRHGHLAHSQEDSDQLPVLASYFEGLEDLIFSTFKCKVENATKSLRALWNAPIPPPPPRSPLNGYRVRWGKAANRAAAEMCSYNVPAVLY